MPLFSFVFILMINYIIYISVSVETHAKRTFLKYTKTHIHTYVIFDIKKPSFFLKDCK